MEQRILTDQSVLQYRDIPSQITHLTRHVQGFQVRGVQLTHFHTLNNFTMVVKFAVYAVADREGGISGITALRNTFRITSVLKG